MMSVDANQEHTIEHPDQDADGRSHAETDEKHEIDVIVLDCLDDVSSRDHKHERSGNETERDQEFGRGSPWLSLLRRRGRGREIGQEVGAQSEEGGEGEEVAPGGMHGGIEGGVLGMLTHQEPGEEDDEGWHDVECPDSWLPLSSRQISETTTTTRRRGEQSLNRSGFEEETEKPGKGKEASDGEMLKVGMRDGFVQVSQPLQEEIDCAIGEDESTLDRLCRDEILRRRRRRRLLVPSMTDAESTSEVPDKDPDAKE